MNRKYLVPVGLTISLTCMLTAILLYPGGTYQDRNTTGFHWTNNYISNLFEAKALNGAPNPSRVWASLAMILLPVTYAIFFFNMAARLPDRNAKIILKYASIANIACMFLIATKLHDLMLNVSITLFWTCILVVTTFVLRSKLTLLKVACIVCLAFFYFGIFLWATNNGTWMPTMQKLNFITSALLILALEYSTSAKEFSHIQPRRKKNVRSSVETSQ
ncbi:MAG: hypothetical protein JNL59_06065 [Chitinophagaceae bacterium]|nr:hypothetical protein [Chitinophagaceae bacterium]